MKAERCPVCYGTGKYIDPPDPMTTVCLSPRTCHGCAGKGWVGVWDGYTGIYYPWIPAWYPYPSTTYDPYPNSGTKP